MSYQNCGCKRAGITLRALTLEVQHCDECDLFESDVDAAAAVDALLLALDVEYKRRGGTVADALDRIVARVQR